MMYLNLIPAKIDELKRTTEEARKEFVALRDSPTGGERDLTASPSDKWRELKWNRLQQELAQATDPAARGPVRLWIARLEASG